MTQDALGTGRVEHAVAGSLCGNRVLLCSARRDEILRIGEGEDAACDIVPGGEVAKRLGILA